MNPNANKATVAALGPLLGVLTSTQTAPLGVSNTSAQGILNLPTLGTAAVKIIAGGQNIGKTRKIKIVVVTPGAHVAWKHVNAGDAAPTVTAAGAGAINEGSLLMNGGGATEELSILDNMDLYLVASAASTVVNITCEEV